MIEEDVVTVFVESRRDVDIALENHGYNVDLVGELDILEYANERAEYYMRKQKLEKYYKKS